MMVLSRLLKSAYSTSLINYDFVTMNRKIMVHSLKLQCSIRKEHTKPLFNSIKHRGDQSDSDSDSDSNSDSDDEGRNKKDKGNSYFWCRKMRTLHRLLDVNQDGVIAYDDFKLLADKFSKLGNLSEQQQKEFQQLLKDTWERMWGCIDEYNLVTTEQYLKDMKNVINDKERRKRVHLFLPYIFKAVDKDKDGVISVPEFALFFNCFGLSSQAASTSFSVIDTNKDNQITLKEFTKLGREYFLSEDENKPSKMFWGPLYTP